MPARGTTRGRVELRAKGVRTMLGRIGRAMAGCANPQKYTRRLRRQLVVTLYGASLVYLVLQGILALGGFVAEDAPDLTARVLYWLIFGVQSLAFGAIVSCVPALLYAEHNYARRPDQQLDERQRLVRDRAYRLAYRILSSVSLAVVVYVLATRLFDGLWRPDGGTVYVAAFVGYCAVVLCLPAAILAWTEPEAPSEADEEQIRTALSS